MKEEKGEVLREKNLSTTQSSDEENTRFPCQNEDQKRARSLATKEKEGAETSYGVMSVMESLTRRRDFAEVFQRGQRKKAGFVKLFFLNRENGSLRVAFVGKSKKAVCRNRVRRRLREAFRVYFYPQWQEKPVDLVFWGDERLCAVRFAEIQSWMGQLLDEVPLGAEAQGNREN